MSTADEKAAPGSSEPRKGGRHLIAVDGLRALAVLVVLVFHLRASALPGGFTGVDIFFVISGYVVSLSLSKHTAEGFSRFISAFYVRRVARIYPALIATLLVTVVFATLFIPDSFLSNSNPKTGWLAFFGLSNWGLVAFNDGYFSPLTEFNPYAHTWSLAVEEQFYVLFPLIFYLWMRRARGRLVGALLPTLSLLSLAYSAYTSLTQSTTAYYFLPSRFWELGAGALLLQAHEAGRALPKNARDRRLWSVAALAMIGLSVGFADSRYFPFPWGLPAVLGTALFISASRGEEADDVPVIRFFSNRTIVSVGLISYSLYLWHWPVAVLLRWTSGVQGAAPIAIAVLASFVLAALSYTLVEVPFKRSLGRASRPWPVLLGGLAVIFLGQKAFLTVVNHQGRLSLSRTKDARDWLVRDIDGNGLPAVDGKPWSGRTLFVAGDSHAGAYSELLRTLNEEKGVRIEVYRKPGCPIVTFRAPGSSGTAECRAFLKDTWRSIADDAKPGDVVLLAALRVERLGDQWATFTDAELDKARNGPEAVRNRVAAIEEADGVIGDLERRGLTVVLDAPLPVFRSPAFRCSDWFNSDNPVCQAGLTISKPFLEEWRRPVMDALDRLRREHPKLVVWDSLNTLCPSDECRAVQEDGRPLFFDGDHLSAHGNEALYPSFRSLMGRVWR